MKKTNITASAAKNLRRIATETGEKMYEVLERLIADGWKTTQKKGSRA
jgi:hypothetical protein